MLPVLFLSHGGGPCFFMDDPNGMFGPIDKNSRAADFYRTLLEKQGLNDGRVRAVVVVSAHWEEKDITVSYQDRGTSLEYDYYGFPAETYAPHLTYPAPTDLELASRISSLLTSHSIRNKRTARGFDHGVFVPMKLIVPDASIPIVQVSLRSDLDPSAHIQLGEALAPLREEGVLLVCSGQTTHNLRSNFNGKPESWAVDFSDWLHTTLTSVNPANAEETKQKLVRIMQDAPGARQSHPREEHLIPVHVAFGAALPALARQAADQSCESSSRCSRLYSQDRKSVV